MFEKILVPLDGSTLAERALWPAVTIAKAMRARLVLMQVVSQIPLVVADPQLYDEMNRMGEEGALAYLRSVSANCPAQVQVELVVDSGSPADALLDYAEQNSVDLIVMSSHGRSGVSRWVYGSVAEKMLRSAPCAVGVICARTETEMFSHKRILVPLDGSPLAEMALQPALDLATAVGAEVHLLRVTLPAHVMMETASMREVFTQIAVEERVEAETYLQSKYMELPNDHLFFEVIMAKESVAESIISYVREHNIDLIVMSSHGRTGISRWMYGSVAEKVLHGACCATLIIRGEPVPEPSEA